jgi:PIN domain nuclease of toxin-antitoxin system
VSLLLDTHAWLWLLREPERLSPAAREAALAEGATLHLSIASLWEIAIKVSIGKLNLSAPARDFLPMALARSAVETLAITTAHAVAVADLPRHHNDPFDRLLIAQAQIDHLTLVSRDPAFRAYDVPVLWD